MLIRKKRLREWLEDIYWLIALGRAIEKKANLEFYEGAVYFIGEAAEEFGIELKEMKEIERARKSCRDRGAERKRDATDLWWRSSDLF